MGDGGGVGAGDGAEGGAGACGVVDLHGGPCEIGDLGATEDEEHEEWKAEGEFQGALAGFGGWETAAGT